MKIKEFFKKRKEQKLKVFFDDGYNWAAGELLKGKPTSYPLSYVECSRCFDNYDKFDEGIETAVEDWIKHLNRKYSTIDEHLLDIDKF